MLRFIVFEHCGIVEGQIGLQVGFIMVFTSVSTIVSYGAGVRSKPWIEAHVPEIVPYVVRSQEFLV